MRASDRDMVRLNCTAGRPFAGGPLRPRQPGGPAKQLGKGRLLIRAILGLVERRDVTICGACALVVLLTLRAHAQLPPGGPWSLRFADEFNDTFAGNQMG